MQSQILLVEDNEDLANLMCLQLSELGCAVHWCADGEEGYGLARCKRFDLIVLDVMLPGMEGTAICSALRSRDSLIPIMLVSAKDAEMDRILGLEIGADDYVSKPFSVLEFRARVKALLRRANLSVVAEDSAQQSRMTLGAVEICLRSRTVLVEGRQLSLTSREYELLCFFAHHPEQVFSREQLLNAIWGYGYDGYQHTVNSHINRLRAKLEPDPSLPRYILTRWGMGYQFVYS